MHIRFAYLDKAQTYNRVHLDLTIIGSFPDKLVMHLAFRWHVNDNIADKLRLTGQAPPFYKTFLVGISRFDSADPAQALRAGTYAMLGKIADTDINLAPPAKRPATTDRININAQRPCRLQHCRAGRHMALPP